MPTETSADANPTAQPTMRAITQRAYGSAEVLSMETVDRPTIKADEVLVEVVAAGLDRGVWHLVTGLPYLVRLMGYGFTRPKNPAGHVGARNRVLGPGEAV
ncbi:MAG: NAD(P)-dependent alcohol dehydrogenase, partial [Actinomycetota bacterium]